MQNGLKIAGLGVHTLHDIDLLLDPGQCVGITGPSGSGKTLLLRAVADLDPHPGGVWLDGVAAGEMAPNLWRRRVALLPAESAWWHDTVGPHLPGVRERWLARLGFTHDVLEWEIARLSSGERQRLGLVRVLALEPRVLLLDEPTANLDAANTRRVEDLLQEYRRDHGAMVVWVGHEQAQLARNCSRIYAIRNGRLEPLASPHRQEGE